MDDDVVVDEVVVNMRKLMSVKQFELAPATQLSSYMDEMESFDCCFWLPAG